MRPTPDTGALFRLLDAQPELQLLADGDGRIAHANVAMAHRLGAPAEVLAGQPLQDWVAEPPHAVLQLLHQGLRSTQSTPARLALRTADCGVAVHRCAVAALQPCVHGAGDLLWLRNPSLSRRCCRWYSAWSRATCWTALGSRPTKATVAP